MMWTTTESKRTKRVLKEPDSVATDLANVTVVYPTDDATDKIPTDEVAKK